MLDWMRSDPIAFFRFMLYRAPAVLLALVLHELAHGYAAYRCGDDTAKQMGRLTLNPLRHLSLVGTILMFTAGMGWAKPVPVNSGNFRHPRRDDLLVSIAGVSVNFCLFLVSTLLTVFVHTRLWSPELFTASGTYLNPFDFLSFGGKNFSQILYSQTDLIVRADTRYLYGYPMAEFLNAPVLLHAQRFLYQFALCNLGMCLFNLLPFPPLDGFHVFNDILLGGRLRLSPRAFQISMTVLFVVVMSTSFISNFLSDLIYAVQGGILRVLLGLFGLS